MSLSRSDQAQLTLLDILFQVAAGVTGEHGIAFGRIDQTSISGNSAIVCSSTVSKPYLDT